MAQLFVIPSKKKSSVAEKQNIKVVVRARPLSRFEFDANVKSIIKYLTQKDILAKDKRFQFDRVFKPEANQIEIYQHVVSPMIPDVLSGYNCTVFAYGQTGSGKTYTMTGSKYENLGNWKEDLEAGIIPRASSHIFDLLPSDRPEKAVKVSYLELYNEEIRDLLSDDDTPLNIYNDMKGSIFIQGLTEVNIKTSEEICEQLQRGNIKRQTAPTLMNHQSSRSHTVFTITIFTKESTSSNEEILKTGKINFVDLAGSENIARSGCKDMRAVELANINRSLLTLGRVIHALADKTKKHVPYRDSKLTRILQDSLGGHTKTCIIATISPASNSIEETLSTLEYASRARDIKNSPTVNEKLSQNQIIDNLFTTIRRLERDLEASRSDVGFYMSVESYKAITDELETLRGEKLAFADVLREKDKQIEELELKIKAKNKEYDDSVEMVEKSRLILDKLEQDINQKKINLRKERFVARTYEQEASQLQKEAQDLFKTTEMLSQESNILQKKLQSQYCINKANENYAREAVTKVLDLLNEISEERINMNDMGESMCQLCKDDIADFKIALHAPLANLKEFFETFDRSLIPDLSIKDNILSTLKEFIYINRKQIMEMKSKFNDFHIRHHKFSDDHMSTFPVFISGIFQKFQIAVDDMMEKINKIVYNEDMEVHAVLSQLEEEISARKKEEEEMKLKHLEDIEALKKEQELMLMKHIKELEVSHLKRMERDEALLSETNFLKELVMNREKSREKFKLQLSGPTRQLKSDVEEVVDNLVESYKPINDDLPSPIKFDFILTETEKFGEELESEVIRLEQLQITEGNEAMQCLRGEVVSNLEELVKSVDTNYDTLNCRFSFLLEDRQRDKKSFAEFSENVNKALSEEFLSRVVTTKHEGDTPARQSQIKCKVLDSIAPREVLLQKFSALPEPVMEEDDKENLANTLNLSTSSFESFRTSSSDIDLGVVEDASKLE